MHRLLSGIALLVGLLLWTTTLSLLFPPENFHLFALGVVAQEWAPWIILWGLAASLAALAPLRRGGAWTRRFARLGLCLNLLALAAVTTVTALSLRSQPFVRSSMPAVLATKPGTFSLMTFIEGPPLGELRPEHQDIVYATIGGEQLVLDLYTPAGPQAHPHPAIVVVHGGAWRAGDKDEMQQSSFALAAEGYIVATLEYRLAPTAIFPAAVGDVKCALGYLRAHAGELGIDEQRIALLGRSSGAQVALTAAYVPDDIIPPSCPARSGRVRAVLAYYPPVALDRGYAPPEESLLATLLPSLSDGAIAAYIGGSPQELPESYRQAVPVHWITRDTPATLIVHGARDSFIPLENSQLLATELERAGVPYALVIMPWADHGFNANFVGVSNQRVQPFVETFLRETMAISAR